MGAACIPGPFLPTTSSTIASHTLLLPVNHVVLASTWPLCQHLAGGHFPFPQREGQGDQCLPLSLPSVSVVSLFSLWIPADLDVNSVRAVMEGLKEDGTVHTLSLSSM